MAHLRKPAFVPRRTIGMGQDKCPDAAGEPLTCRLWLQPQLLIRVDLVGKPDPAPQAGLQPGIAPFYTSPEIFQADLDIIFGRHWIYVGVEPDVPEPGDCMVVDIDRASIIIARDDDMGLRAFHNVCRHRGARLVHDEKTTVGNIVCRYHQWTYGLDGSLLYAEHMGPGFDTTCHGLKKVHLRSVAGLIFICLADEPPADIDEMARALEPYIAPHDIAQHQGRPADRPDRGRQLEAHDGEQS